MKSIRSLFGTWFTSATTILAVGTAAFIQTNAPLAVDVTVTGAPPVSQAVYDVMVNLTSGVGEFKLRVIDGSLPQT